MRGTPEAGVGKPWAGVAPPTLAEATACFQKILAERQADAIWHALLEERERIKKGLLAALLGEMEECGSMGYAVAHVFVPEGGADDSFAMDVDDVIDTSIANWRAARRQALDEAARVAREHYLTVRHWDDYPQLSEDIAAAIEALKEGA